MSDTKSSIDPEMLDQLRELLGDRFEELVRRFVGDGERRISLIRSAIKSNSDSHDFDVIYAEAHGLKGSGRNVGAGPLGDLCDKLEAKGKVANAENIELIFAALEQEFATVCELLRA